MSPAAPSAPTGMVTHCRPWPYTCLYTCPDMMSTRMAMHMSIHISVRSSRDISMYMYVQRPIHICQHTQVAKALRIRCLSCACLYTCPHTCLYVCVRTHVYTHVHTSAAAVSGESVLVHCLHGRTRSAAIVVCVSRHVGRHASMTCVYTCV